MKRRRLWTNFFWRWVIALKVCSNFVQVFLVDIVQTVLEVTRRTLRKHFERTFFWGELQLHKFAPTLPKNVWLMLFKLYKLFVYLIKRKLCTNFSREISQLYNFDSIFSEESAWGSRKGFSPGRRTLWVNFFSENTYSFINLLLSCSKIFIDVLQTVQTLFDLIKSKLWKTLLRKKMKPKI